MNTEMTEIGIWHNTEKAGVLDVAGRLLRAFEAHGVRCRMSQDLAEALGIQRPIALDGYRGCDLMCVLGGDGTLLSALDSVYENGMPVLGINMGRMGFLSEVQLDDLEADIDQLMRGDYRLEQRMVLSARLPGDGTGVALNEVAINRTGSSAGILSIEIEAGGILVDRFSGDGLIVASATGSTAYSLSAGGPIVSPGMDLMVLTPICPHTLHARPVIIPSDQPVVVRVLGDRGSARVMLDGRHSLTFQGEDHQVVIERAERDIRFVRLHEPNFFELLRSKLSDWTH